MASSGSTPNYHLPQWAGTDRPATREDFNSAFSSIDGDMKNIADAVTQDAANVAAISNRMSNVENTVGQYDDAIDALETSVSNLSETVTSQTTSINSLNTSVTSNTNNISSLDSRVSAVETNVSGLSDDVSTMQTNVSNNTQNITENAADIQNLENEFTALGVTNVTTATSLKNTINGHTTSIANINNDISALQSSDTTQNTNISNLQLGVNELKAMFNLNGITNSSVSATVNSLTLAQNTTGTVFKFYGAFKPSTALSRVAVPGGSSTFAYGIDSGLVLNSSPSAAYAISCAGRNQKGSGSTWEQISQAFAVGTDGHIYFCVRETQAQGQLSTDWTWIYDPQLYFNTNFGDIPIIPE